MFIYYYCEDIRDTDGLRKLVMAAQLSESIKNGDS
jgi:hypothetical protein